MKDTIKKLIRNAVRKRGFDIVRTPNLNSFLASREVDLVLDVGANSGGFGVYIRRWGYEGDILSLEPTRAAFGELSRRCAADPRWTALKVAAGEKPGTAVINVSRADGFSSFKSANALGLAYDPLIEVASTEDVDVITLDSILPQLAGKRPFLKIDTQGFEREVLNGARRILDRCEGVFLELPIEHLYDGVWRMSEALDAMEDAGFALAQIAPTNPRHPDYESAVEFDCVFRRINPVGHEPRAGYVSGVWREKVPA